MAETVSFALRMPRDLKRAAEALTKVDFSEPSGQEDIFQHRYLSSINEAILYLMRSGIRTTLAHFEREIEECKREYDIWQEIVLFFIENPAAQFATPDKFSENSRARSHIADIMDSSNDWIEGVGRAKAADEFAHIQRRLLKVTEVKGFLQQACFEPKIPFPTLPYMR